MKLLFAILLASNLLLHSPSASAAEEETFVFETGDSKTTEAFRGSFKVPENRSNPDSRMIPITYVRFPATGQRKGPPIIYLAGGPGGSGVMTAKYYRFAMFMALRDHGDVIALDQRGTGASNILPECTSNQVLPESRRISDAEFIWYHKQALRDCLAFWKADGVDISGYNTVENARDLDALRKHLGAEKVILWGTSYGSHLALAALKEMEDRIEKVVISSAEGLNQTVKMPSRTDAYFDRLQKAINSQPEAQAAYPDIKALIGRVHDRLESDPMLLHLTMKNGAKADYLMQRRDMQQVASAMISDPWRANRLLSLYLAMDNGITAPVEQVFSRSVESGKPISLDPMSTAMDIASGMTRDRRDEVLRQAETALLKDYLNFSYHYDGVAPELDLGDEFRTKPSSHVPVLLLSGTLDGRTYIESQREAVSELENLTTITVENAGHNLFMSSVEVQDAIDRFLEDKPVLKSVIKIDLPDMAPPK